MESKQVTASNYYEMRAKYPKAYFIKENPDGSCIGLVKMSKDEVKTRNDKFQSDFNKIFGGEK